MEITPIIALDFEEPILKIIKIDNYYLCGYSQKNAYLIKYDTVMNNCNEDIKYEKDIIKINFNIVKKSKFG